MSRNSARHRQPPRRLVMADLSAWLRPVSRMRDRMDQCQVIEQVWMGNGFGRVGWGALFHRVGEVCQPIAASGPICVRWRKSLRSQGFGSFWIVVFRASRRPGLQNRNPPPRPIVPLSILTRGDRSCARLKIQLTNYLGISREPDLPSS